MNLLSVKIIKELLLKHNAEPSKYMGQNFLIDNSALSKIIKTSELTKEDTVLEIGPGLGILTKELAGNAGQVVAIEKDRTMVAILEETLKDNQNVTIVQGDALKYNHKLKKYKIIANIPYYLTSPLIRKFLEEKIQPDFMVLMVQKEVAQRICSKPPNMSLLAVAVQFYADPKIISYVSKECFWPAPKIDSAIIKITPRKIASKIKPEDFFKVVKAGFSHPRKQLANNLSTALNKNKEEISEWLLKNKINPMQRSETLNLQNWLDLTDSL